MFGLKRSLHYAAEINEYHHHGDFHGTNSSKRKISLLLVPVKGFYEPLWSEKWPLKNARWPWSKNRKCTCVHFMKAPQNVQI